MLQLILFILPTLCIILQINLIYISLSLLLLLLLSLLIHVKSVFIYTRKPLECKITQIKTVYSPLISITCWLMIRKHCNFTPDVLLAIGKCWALLC